MGGWMRVRYERDWTACGRAAALVDRYGQSASNYAVAQPFWGNSESKIRMNMTRDFSYLTGFSAATLTNVVRDHGRIR